MHSEDVPSFARRHCTEICFASHIPDLATYQSIDMKIARTQKQKSKQWKSKNPHSFHTHTNLLVSTDMCIGQISLADFGLKHIAYSLFFANDLNIFIFSLVPRFFPNRYIFYRPFKIIHIVVTEGIIKLSREDLSYFCQSMHNLFFINESSRFLAIVSISTAPTGALMISPTDISQGN